MKHTVVIALLGLLDFASGKPGQGVPTLHQGGGAESYIVGGSEAADGQWPSILSLEYLGANGWSHTCGAVLYKDQYALTAAHCVYGYAVSSLRLWAGTLFRDNPAATDGQVVPIERYVMHPNFQPGAPGVPNNLAVIRLTVPADTTHPNIANAVLPPDDTNDFTHGGCYAVGYGRTDTSSGGPMSNSLQWLKIPVIPNADCKAQVLQVGHADIFDTHICVLSDPTGLGPCNGDAGGPLYCHPTELDTSVTYLAGVNSWNVAVSGGCNLQYPSVSTRISKYQDWIDSVTQ